MSAVRVEERGPVLLITLDRPHVLNAVDGAMTHELGAAIDSLERNPAIRVGVVTGSGRAFCTGLDMAAVAAGASIEATRHPLGGFAGITARDITKPLVAAVNGHAVGGGLEIALACDLIVAAEGARLGLPEVAHGVFAAGGGVLRLARAVPERIAREMLLTGRLLEAAEAHAWGLVAAVVEPSRVVDEAMRLALEIARHAPLAVQATRRVLALAPAGDPLDARTAALVDAEASRVFASADAIEGITAFVERRPPRFVGA